MSLRIITRPEQIVRWITDRQGAPARKRGTDADLKVVFGHDDGDYERLSTDDLFQRMRFHHLVMLVEQEPGQTYHRFIQHA